jgi:hypothetical protein
MPIQTNLKSLVPARERFKKEVKLLSGAFSMRDQLPEGKLIIYPWDQSIDDWVMKNLKKVNLVLLPYELCKRVTGLDNVDRLPVGDVSTILLVSKALARNSQVEYMATCHACGHKEHTKIVVPDNLERVSEKGPDYPGYDEITLPVVKDVIRIRPLLVKDEISITERATDAIPRRVARAIAAVVSINGGTPDNADELLSYLNALQPSDLDYLLDQMNVLDPHLGTEMKHKCDKCGTEFTHNIAIDAEFFR